MSEQTGMSSFGNLLDDPYNPLIEQAMAMDRIPIGYTCSYVPEVLLSVQKLFPVRLRAPHISGTEISDTYLSNVTCSYTRSLLEFAMESRFDFLSGWIFTASCDHLRRLCDNLEYLLKPDFIHILDVPHKLGSRALKWYLDELVKLTQRLSESFGIEFSPDNIEAAINNHNQYYLTINAIGDLRKLTHPKISGTDFHKLFLSGLTCPKDLLVPQIERIYEELKQSKGISDYRARLMVVGSELDDPGYIKTIESMGALVVADRFCTGSFPGASLIENCSKTKTPLERIASHTLQKTSCPRMMEEFNNRVDQISQIAREYHVDGIVVEVIKFCDLWGVEGSPLVDALRQSGFEVLRLEREYRQSGEGQLKTRIQAFLEKMGK